MATQKTMIGWLFAAPFDLAGTSPPDGAAKFRPPGSYATFYFDGKTVWKGAPTQPERPQFKSTTDRRAVEAMREFT